MRSKLVQAVVATAMTGAVVMAQAATVNLSGWAYGSGNTVSVGAPNHHGRAGGFIGSVDFSPSEEAAGFKDIFGNNFITYCVEINEHFSLPSGNMLNYAVVAGSDYSSVIGPLGAAKASRIGQLMSYVNSDASLVDNAAKSTSLQLAVWNVVYDSDNELDMGPFKENSANDNFRSYAEDLLEDSLNAQNKYDVYILQRAGSQDFLLLRELPEPTSLALAFVALGGMGFIGRRRKA